MDNFILSQGKLKSICDTEEKQLFFAWRRIHDV